ncbi:MAG: LLM class flavin-dependent oxidoreductase [Candidatus Rokubacteria bacterium]|nr:LLM class flavin-dependent oxidoreductase [Candidatus Rokubacteria bacterium]
MPVEIIGMIGVKPEGADGAAVHVIGGAVDTEWLRAFAQAHETSGFDRVLVGYTSTSAEGFAVTGYAAAHTERLGYLIAHRPGFVAPTLTARAAATLDHVTNGRIALHIITGGSDAEQTRDGDWLDHDTRYRRTDEYLGVLRRMWTASEPFDHEGEFYRFAKAFSDVKPLRPGGIPLYFGGASGAAADVAAKHCDVYALWGEPLAAVKQRIADIHGKAVAFRRRPRISVSLRPIIAPTEAEAWERARGILARVRQTGRHIVGEGPGIRPQAVGAQRLVEFAREAEVHDTRLWTAIAAAMGGAGNTTALVGTPEQVAESLLAYYDIGCTTLLIRGFDPLNDARDYGRALIPLVRSEVARRDRAAMVST